MLAVGAGRCCLDFFFRLGPNVLAVGAVRCCLDFFSRLKAYCACRRCG